jgi:hypothetical protein
MRMMKEMAINIGITVWGYALFPYMILQLRRQGK